jgi:CRP-like cAMP-binding protein
MPHDALTLTEGLPERALAAGDTLFTEGDLSSSVVVLVAGELVVEGAGLVIDRHTRPGTFVGETGALLGQPRGATVTAALPTVIREIGDPDDFFAKYPKLGLEVARQLARRVHRLNGFVAAVQCEFGSGSI